MRKGGAPITEHMKRHEYSSVYALRICEQIASGLTLKELCEYDDMPSIVTVYKWLSLYPPFFDAFHRAKEISAMSLEEEALLMARELKEPNDFTGVKVQAYNIAMQQLRWSASRRDPAKYGQKALDGGGKVTITINSSLNLAQDGRPATEDQKNIYTIEFEPNITEPDSEFEPPDLEVDYEAVDNAPEPRAEQEAESGLAFGVPETVDHGFRQKPVRQRGPLRGVKGHRKSAAQTKSSASRMAAKLAKLTGGARDMEDEEE